MSPERTLSRRPEQPVADAVTVGVVDVLELVEIEVVQGEPLVVAPRGETRLAQPVLEEKPVRQAGQRVESRQMLELLLVLLPLPDVPELDKDRLLTAVIERPGPQLDRDLLAAGRQAEPLQARELTRDQAAVTGENPAGDVRRHQLRHAHADQLLLVITLELRGSAVYVQHFPLEILDEDWVGRCFEEIPEPLLARLELELGTFALHHLSDVLGNDTQDLEVLRAVEKTILIALNSDHAEHLVPCRQRCPEPDRRGCADQLDFSFDDQSLVDLFVHEQRDTRPPDVVGQTPAQLLRWQFVGLELVDVIREGVAILGLVIESNVEIGGVDQGIVGAGVQPGDAASEPFNP